MNNPNIQTITEYVDELMLKYPDSAINPKWFKQIMTELDHAEINNLLIDPEYLRAEFEVSFDGERHSIAPLISL
jgi:hypothetical protein